MMLRRHKENKPVEIPAEILIEQGEPQVGADPETLKVDESVEIPAEPATASRRGKRK